MHVQDDLNLHILSMFKGTFSLDTAHMIKGPILPDLVHVALTLHGCSVFQMYASSTLVLLCHDAQWILDGK